MGAYLELGTIIQTNKCSWKILEIVSLTKYQDVNNPMWLQLAKSGKAPPAQLSKASIHPIISLSRDPHQPSTGCTSLGSRDTKGLITRPSRFPHPAQDTNTSNHNSHLSSHNNPLNYSLTPHLATNLSTKTYFTHKPTTRPSQQVSVWWTNTYWMRVKMMSIGSWEIKKVQDILICCTSIKGE